MNTVKILFFSLSLYVSVSLPLYHSLFLSLSLSCSLSHSVLYLNSSFFLIFEVLNRLTTLVYLKHVETTDSNLILIRYPINDFNVITLKIHPLKCSTCPTKNYQVLLCMCTAHCLKFAPHQLF